MRFRRHEDGSLEPLPESNVDTGMGLERLMMVLQDKRSVFSIDVFEPWMRTVPPLWRLDDESLRVVCDHLRSSVVVIGEGVRPSNTGRGYVLRRLLRRVLTTMWRDDPDRTLSDLPVEPIEDTLHHFGQSSSVHEVRDVLIDEERRFSTLLRRGRVLVSQQRYSGPLTEDDYRYLHDTHGLPRDLVQTLLP
jgi:alanyl-tRNA synthetase